ncbi:PilZ domain-containing protein [Vibrio sp. PP-XX7]
MIEQDFFTVLHSLAVNIEPLSADFSFPDEASFEAEIPISFVVASEFSQLDQLGDLARQELKNNDFRSLIQLFDSQNRKLNLLLNFMLSQQDDPLLRHQTKSFGASQFIYVDSSPLTIDTPLRVKLFLDHPPAAIYCYAHVESCQPQEDHYLISVRYDLLRDFDQDLLIKAALHQQQKILRQRSVERDK